MSTFRITGLALGDEREPEPQRKEEGPPFVVRASERMAKPMPSAAGSDEPRGSERHAKAACKPKLREKKADPKQTGNQASTRGSISSSTRSPEKNQKLNGNDARSGGPGSEAAFAGLADPLALVLDLHEQHEDGTADERESGFDAFDDSLDPANNVFGQREKEPFAGGMGDRTFASATDGAMNFEPLMDKLAPMTADDGIFEVLMPDGESMGVVVNAQPTLVSFFLSPSNEKTSKLLRPQQMELEGLLERRIGRNVKITVL